jgi:hypothetical protein
MQFREVIRPPLWLLAFIYFMFLSLVIAIWAALGNRPAAIAFLAATAGIFTLAYAMKSEICVDASELRVAGAHIDLKYIKSATALDRDQLRRARTREADPAAFLAFNFWVSTGVKVILEDPRDPTPYWLITTRRAKELTSTLCR